MIFIHVTPQGARRVADLQDIYHRQTAMLVGGAPSLLKQPIEMLGRRGVLTMAINNAARHFQPALWVSGDNPNCYEPQILHDARIMKFAPYAHANALVQKQKYSEMPNMFFYVQEENVPWDEYFACKRGVPWYYNTLFVSIHILYRLGIRRIILAGSDFGYSAEGEMYAHRTDLGNKERKWNQDLYNGLVRQLCMLKPLFEAADLQLLDCSKNSRISHVYDHITLQQAVELCLEKFPTSMADPTTLPHCSKFAPKSILDKMAKWPGYGKTDDTAAKPTVTKPETEKTIEII